MSFSRVIRAAVLLSATVCMMALFASPARAEDKSPGMVQWEALSKQFVQLRDVDARRLGPQDLLAAAEAMEKQLNDLIQASAGDPSAKSKAQELLSLVFEFDGKAPEARLSYSQFLDTLEGWQGKDYAVMAVRQAGDRMLEQVKNPSKAIQYYDLLLEKYPDHESKAHALYHSGLACIDAKSYKEAAARFDKALAANPKNYYAPWALRKKAYALAEMVSAGGDFSASLAALDQLEKGFPNPHWGGYACYRRGFTLERSGKQLEAMVEYQKGMNKYPTSPYSIWSQKLAQKLQEKVQQQMIDQQVQNNKDRHDLVTDQSPSTGGPQG